MATNLSGKKILVTGPTGQVARPGHAGAGGGQRRRRRRPLPRRRPRERLEAARRHLRRASISPATRLRRRARRRRLRAEPRGREVGNADWDVDLAANAEAAGLLMAHCQHATAFLHCSSTGVYEPAGSHALRRDRPARRQPPRDDADVLDLPRSRPRPSCAPSARQLDLPTTIARLNVPYGDNGGWPALPPRVHPRRRRRSRCTPTGRTSSTRSTRTTSSRMLPALLDVASVPATIVNWGGDRQTSTRGVGRLPRRARRPRGEVRRQTDDTIGGVTTDNTRDATSSCGEPRRSTGATACAGWSRPVTPNC